jgi:hypothetical protein
MRDAVLQGAETVEIEALAKIARSQGNSIAPALARRLQAKGWIDSIGEEHLLTICGRTLIDRN